LSRMTSHLGFRIALSLVSVTLFACSSAIGSGDGSADGGNSKDAGGDAAVCRTVASPSSSRLPHVDATGAKAASVIAAIDAIAGAQMPPVKADNGGYVLPSLDCHDLWVEGPDFVDGYSCEFSLDLGDEPPVKVEASAPSKLAQTLFDALRGAGSSSCDDMAHGDFIHLEKVRVTANHVEFDDASTYETVFAPNLRVQGVEAQAVMDALAGAGLDDCDPRRKLALACHAFAAEDAPTCSYDWADLTTVGTSELLYACGPASGARSAGGNLDTKASQAVWNAILAAAKVADFKPLEGTIAQTTIVNASYFSWNGQTLGLTLVTDDATPPPAPPSAPESTPSAPSGA
jgi:hypothetical protein